MMNKTLFSLFSVYKRLRAFSKKIPSIFGFTVLVSAQNDIDKLTQQLEKMYFAYVIFLVLFCVFVTLIGVAIWLRCK